MPEEIEKLYQRCQKRLARYLPESIACERAFNLCLVMAGIRPACLWYIDPDYEKSVAFLETVQTDGLQYTVGLGKIDVPSPTGPEDREEINIPHTLILRLDNSKAVELANSATFESNIFASHKDLGEALGYYCAGDDSSSTYHVEITGVDAKLGIPFVVMEQMCKERHRQKFRDLAQRIQDFAVGNGLPIQIDLFTTSS